MSPGRFTAGKEGGAAAAGPGRFSGRRRLAAPLLAALGALLSAGCAALPPNLAGGGTLAVDRVDSCKARLGPLRVTAEGAVLRVSGSLSDPVGEFRSLPGRLSIEAFGEGDRPLAQVEVSYKRLGVRARQSRFSTTLAVEPDSVRRLRVVHRPPANDGC